MSESERKSGEKVARTDICENCEYEIVSEATSITGQHKLIHQARQADVGVESISGGSVEISFSCRCSHVKVEYGPGSAAAYRIPEGWLWKDGEDDE